MVAIEFAFLAIPFFLVLFAIMEVALILTAGMQIEHATDRVSRRIMTGEVAREPSAIRSSLCDELVLGFDCNAMKIDYREVASVKDFDLPLPVFHGVVDETAFGFATIAEPSFASLRVGYAWPIIIRPLAVFLKTATNGRVFLVGTALIRIEA